MGWGAEDAAGARPREKKDLHADCCRTLGKTRGIVMETGGRVKIAYLSPGLGCPLDVPKSVFLADPKEWAWSRRQGLVAPRKGESWVCCHVWWLPQRMEVA